MIRNSVKKTKLFNEVFNDPELLFGISNRKIIPYIDNIYYAVFLQEEYYDYEITFKNDDDVWEAREDTLVDVLVDFLESNKQQLIENPSDPLEIFDNVFMTTKSYSIYKYCISKENCFDIFISSYLPNKSTPRIVVQCRANSLWTNGVTQTLHDSIEFLKKFLIVYKLKISKVQENRIDYCYHTNYYESMNFLNDEFISDNIETSYSIGSKVFQKGSGSIDLKYLSFGKRQSNNTFFRLYDKTNEVVQLAYKGFFLDIWHKSKLISYYDKFCLEEAYKHKNYMYIYHGMMKFYIKYGTDNTIKAKFNKALNDTNLTLKDYKILTKGICPPVTLVINLEFQTMRKFYYSSDNVINTLPTNCTNELQRLFRILDNRKMFLDYLTSNTLKFVDDLGNMNDFWKRLRKVKIKDLSVDRELIREYALNLDMENIRNRTIRDVATYALYKDNLNTSLSQDLSLYLNYINDNSSLWFDNGECTLINSETGELLQFDEKGYDLIKRKRKKALQPALKRKNKNTGKDS